LYVFPTRNIVNFLNNFPFLKTATYFSKAQYSLFVLKVPLNLNQSINQSWADWAAWLPGTFQVGRLVHYPCK